MFVIGGLFQLQVIETDWLKHKGINVAHMIERPERQG